MNEKICNFCNKLFATKQNCNIHKTKCKSKSHFENQNLIIKLQEENNRLQEENNRLQEENNRLQEENVSLKNIIANKSKSEEKVSNQINNNNNNNNTQINIINTTPLSLKDILANLEPIDFNEIKTSFENNLSNKYIDNGLEGLANFICDIPCQNKIITTDYARKVVSYKTSHKKIVTDPQANILLNTAIQQNADTIIDKAEDRHKYWKSQIRDAIDEDIEPHDIDVKNKKNTAKLIKTAANSKHNIPTKSKEATSVFILKGVETKNNLNALE